MGRRKSNADHVLDELLDLLVEVPWWIGPGLAGIVFLLFRFLVPAFFPVRVGSDLVAQIGRISDPVFRGLSISAAPWLAGIIMVVWLIAEGKKFGQRRMFDAQSGLASIRELSWQDFEQLLAEAYRRQGYAAEVTGNSSGDGGIDVVLRRGDERLLVQCKHWKEHCVGVKPIRELLGVVTAERASGGILVTSGEFTEEAKRFAKETAVSLVDGALLEELVGGLRRTKSASPPASVLPTGTSAPALAAMPAPISCQSQETPTCPQCGSPMILRTVRKGPTAGSKFWGCSVFSKKGCRGTREIA